MDRYTSKTEQYIESLIRPRTGTAAEIEVAAKADRVPIMEPAGMEAILQLLSLQNPESVLEIGTAIGYSSLRFAEQIPDARIVTIERDTERIRQAVAYHKQAGLLDRIVIIEGDALETGDTVKSHGPFDALFIDAAKGQYSRFFELYEPMVRPGGVIFSDNILFKGFVAGEKEPEKKRIKTMVSRLQNFNTGIMEDDRFHSMIYPVGDGLMVSIKKHDESK
ncbi:SAM-dependent methyltransferase [Alteribacter lacisalsi]|uniref:tRNA 5-hydroxyuridine methyltransferase n=1 Tax=Alteribacter lacisalsi TaxID=2045244 RepID=A0A2W0HPG9_9BACI|nr:O-methyltransferase [Alteribacter lacisalsi]PYZ98779.1 SAM-dependent methyltransferase [Alteribacter lacisalsi]